MRRKLTLSLACAAAAMVLLPTTSMANPAPAAGDLRAAIAQDHASFKTVQYWRRDRRRWRRGYRRCRSWRHECADRWGWGSRRFYRCLRRHAC